MKSLHISASISDKDMVKSIYTCLAYSSINYYQLILIKKLSKANTINFIKMFQCYLILTSKDLAEWVNS